MSYTPFKMKGPSLYRNMNAATKKVGDKPKDINKNGQIEGWEQARFDAIKSNSPATMKSPVKGYKSDAQRKAVHASKADGGKGAPKYKSPTKVVGSNQEKTREDDREYKDDKSVVRSAQMQRLMDNKPAASDKEAMKRWQASYDKAFNAFKKKKGKA